MRNRARWYEFLPEVVLFAGLGLFAITEPHVAAAGLKSTKAIVLMVTVALLWIVGRLALWAGVRWPALRLAVFAVAAVAILKVVVLPSYDDHTVNEALPVAVQAADSAKVRLGELSGINHRASGIAALYVASDRRVTIGLEDFDIQPGPAYALYIVSGADRQDHDGGTRVDGLRGNKGTQFYEAPSSIDVTDGDWTVLVWCETFDVAVANATPTA